VRKALAGLIKLARDANWSDKEISYLLREAALAIEMGHFFTWSQK
jgi:hypothetical protein